MLLHCNHADVARSVQRCRVSVIVSIIPLFLTISLGEMQYQAAPHTLEDRGMISPQLDACTVEHACSSLVSMHSSCKKLACFDVALCRGMSAQQQKLSQQGSPYGALLLRAL